MSVLYSLLLCFVVICVQNELVKQMDEHQVTEPLSLERQMYFILYIYLPFVVD